jgi:hypothetical protein
MNTELEQRLRSDMERVTQGVRVPQGLALKAYRHSQKRKTTRAVTAAGAVIVLAAALAGAKVSGAFGPASGQQVQATAYLVSRVEHALSAPSMNNVVAFTRTVYPAGITLQPKPGGMTGSGGTGASPARSASYVLVWAYHHTSKFSGFTAGRRVFDERITRVHGSPATTAVIYSSHTWWTATGIAGPAGNAPASSGCLPGGEIRLQGGTALAWPDFIRSQLACGAYTVTDRQAVVDKVHAIEITGSSGQVKLWVNRATYLPVQLDRGGLTTSFRWMPPTPASLALLHMPVPAGFQQVPPPS